MKKRTLILVFIAIAAMNLYGQTENKYHMMPAITSVSYTLPQPGDRIFISGNNLENTTEVYFPGPNGEVTANIINTSKTKVYVTVPKGVGKVSGAIRIVCNGDEFYSPKYMFFKKGIFISTFNEPDVVKFSGGGESNTQRLATRKAVLNATGLRASSNPESAIAWGTKPADVLVASGNNAQYSHIKFLVNKGFRNVIANSEGAITESSVIKDLAIQFDLYMLTPWTSGVIAVKMNKDQKGMNSSNIHNLAPWSVDKPFAFDSGWQTMTVKFSQFPGLVTSQTLGEYIALLETNANRQQLLGFYNFDVNTDGHTPTPIPGFQMFIANVRLVPITVPE
jgi:hypothetical protein